MIRDKVILFFFFALFLFVCYQIYLIFAPFLTTLFWAATVALIVFPLHTFMLKLVKKRPSIAALLTTIIVVLVALPLGILIGTLMARQALDLYDVARQYVSGGGVASMLEWLRNFDVLRALEDRLLQSAQIQQKLSNIILNSAKAIGTFATAQMAGLGKNIAVSIVQIVLGIFFLFFIFRDGPRFYSYVYDIVPLKDEHKATIFQMVNNTFSAVLRGQFLTAFVQGVSAGIVFFLLGIPLPILLGFLTFLSAMIPIMGAGGIWVPVDIYLFATNQTGKGFILLLIGVFGLSLMDNLLKPILIGQKAKLPTLLLFLGLIGGLKLYGILGIFMGPVVLTLFFVLINIYQQDLQGAKT